jgi:hypothetical protein
LIHTRYLWVVGRLVRYEYLATVAAKLKDKKSFFAPISLVEAKRISLQRMLKPFSPPLNVVTSERTAATPQRFVADSVCRKTGTRSRLIASIIENSVCRNT